MTTTGRLHIVASTDGPPPASPDLGADGDVGDLALAAILFAISFLPILGAVAHVGRWGQGELGLGTLGSLFAGRELLCCARAALRARSRP